MPDHQHLMKGLTVQHLRFRVRPTESISFGRQPGSALRGALFQVLSDNFCSEPDGPVTPGHKERCPVCWMLTAEDRQDERGRNIPRPLTVEPPPNLTYHRDEDFSFGLSLIGQAQDLLPYLARAVQKMGTVGVGRGRGRFKLLGIDEHNPLLDTDRVLMEQQVVKRPTLQITPAMIQRQANQLPTASVTLELMTPLRLTNNGQLVKSPEPVAFAQRLVERCERLALHYAEVDTDTPPDWRAVFLQLTSAAAALTVGADYTLWQDEWSGSRRQGRWLPIGGLVGTVRWEGDVAPLLPWLLWGQSLHVGKSAVKGNGWYRVVH